MSGRSSAHALALEATRIWLSFRTDFVLYPIDADSFAKSLVSHGYALGSERTRIGAVTISAAGALARKDGNTVVLNQASQVIGVEGESPDAVVKTFDEIENIVIGELDVELRHSTLFYEFIAEYTLPTDRNPRKVFQNLSGLTALSSEISGVFGEKLSPFVLRFGTRDAVPQQQEWMDVRIEPLIVKADKAYFLSVVFRSQDKDKVEKTLVSLPDSLPKVIGLIERGA